MTKFINPNFLTAYLHFEDCKTTGKIAVFSCSHNKTYSSTALLYKQIWKFSIPLNCYSSHQTRVPYKVSPHFYRNLCKHSQTMYNYKSFIKWNPAFNIYFCSWDTSFLDLLTHQNKNGWWNAKKECYTGLTSTGSLVQSLDNTVNITIFLDTHLEWGSSQEPKSGVKANFYQHS